MEKRVLNNCMEYKFETVLYCPEVSGIAPGEPKLELRQNQLLYSRPFLQILHILQKMYNTR